MMRCAESLELLQKRLDGETAEVPGLDQHLRDCLPCRELHRAGSMLADRAAEPPLPAASADLTQRIVRAVLDDRRLRLKRWRSATAAAALAASLLIAATVYVTWPGERVGEQMAENGNGQAKEQPVIEAAEVDLPEAGPSLQESVADMGVAMTSLTERLAGQTREHAEILWQAASPIDLTALAGIPAADEMADPLAPAAEPLRKAGQGVSRGIETVANSARRAVDYFMRELALLDEPSN